ncbi:MAG: carboxymuconolactone decarboxylase family protein [Rhodospirillales bacterium]|nr:carboxymuconolactone decarboxylase family protein [Rhodospirillales bacterium]MCB9994955.1 carboxymuconolactone decarboxylase family protein [Rhodospirillales bacterium]
MSIDSLKEKLPEYAKDLKLNLSSLSQEEILNEQQLWGCFLASALTGRNAEVIAAIGAEAAQHLSAEAMEAAKGAAAIMAMNNVYYKFTGMMGDDYRTMQAKLRMNIIGNPGVDKIDFELWSIAVSAINGCQYCVKSHEQKVVHDGMSREQVQAAVRIASVVQAVSAVLDGVDAMAAGGIAAAA